MRIRKRVTLDEKVYNAAVEYSKLDNRTFSALMQTAVEQMMHRYPKSKIDISLEKQVQIMRKEMDIVIGKMEEWSNENR